jgi:hypothetical protein
MAPPAGREFEANAIEVDLARGSGKALLVLLPLLLGLCSASVYAAVDAHDRSVLIVGCCFAAFFGVLLCGVVKAIPRLVQPRGLVFDARGVHFWRGSAWDLLPWEDVAAIGVGYEQPPRVPTLSLSRYLARKMLDELNIGKWTNICVEIFPDSPARTLERHPALARYRRQQAPPFPQLPPQRWRLPLPPLSDLGHQVGKGVEAFQPRRWVGWFERPRRSR